MDTISEAGNQFSTGQNSEWKYFPIPQGKWIVRGYAIICHLPVQGGYSTPLDVDHMNKSSLLEVW